MEIDLWCGYGILLELVYEIELRFPLQGLVIDQIRASKGEKNELIYIGDGGGDYCPTLRLQEVDHVMPRKLYPLSDRINSNQTLVKAKIHEWSDGKELEKILLNLLDVK